MNALTDEQRQAILDEVIAATMLPERKPYQFTRREYQERAGVSQHTAEGYLEKAVGTGLLLKKLIFHHKISFSMLTFLL